RATIGLTKSGYAKHIAQGITAQVLLGQLGVQGSQSILGDLKMAGIRIHALQISFVHALRQTLHGPETESSFIQSDWLRGIGIAVSTQRQLEAFMGMLR